MLEFIRKFLPENLAGALLAVALALACAVAGILLLHAARQLFALKDRSERDYERAVNRAGVGIVLLAASVVFFATALLADQRAWIIAGTSVFLFGAAVGAAELISRYKDNPVRALLTAPGFFYVFLNAAGSAAALYLIYVFREPLGFVAKDTTEWPDDPGTLVKAVLIAGSSSLVFFRSAIFKFRVGDSDLAIGPSIVLDTLSAAADRAVDRNMAGPRAVLVHELMADIAFDKAAAILSQHCVALMQNVSSEESQRIVGIVNKLRADKDIPDKIKTLNLGLALLSVVGEKVLRTAVEYLRADLQDSTAKLLNEVVSVMHSVSFEKARRILPTYCFALWPSTIPDDVAQKLFLDLKALAELSPQEAPESYKSLFLGIRLARATDGATLRKAVEDLGDAIKPARLAAPEPAEPGPATTTATTVASGGGAVTPTGGTPPVAVTPTTIVGMPPAAVPPASTTVAGAPPVAASPTLPAAPAAAQPVAGASPSAGASATAGAPTATPPAGDATGPAGPDASGPSAPDASAPDPADKPEASASSKPPAPVPGVPSAEQATKHPGPDAAAVPPPATKPDKTPAGPDKTPAG
ncbi:MAG: hypothetical protein U1E21_00855 [Reyranellaceae bacterium]